MPPHAPRPPPTPPALRFRGFQAALVPRQASYSAYLRLTRCSLHHMDLLALEDTLALKSPSTSSRDKLLWRDCIVVGMHDSIQALHSRHLEGMRLARYVYTRPYSRWRISLSCAKFPAGNYSRFRNSRGASRGEGFRHFFDASRRLRFSARARRISRRQIFYASRAAFPSSLESVAPMSLRVDKRRLR